MQTAIGANWCAGLRDTTATGVYLQLSYDAVVRHRDQYSHIRRLASSVGSARNDKADRKSRLNTPWHLHEIQWTSSLPPYSSSYLGGQVDFRKLISPDLHSQPWLALRPEHIAYGAFALACGGFCLSERQRPPASYGAYPRHKKGRRPRPRRFVHLITKNSILPT